MPIKLHNTKNKSFYQYGNSGTKYYFDKNSINSIMLAYYKAKKQAAAVHVNKKIKR